MQHPYLLDLPIYLLFIERKNYKYLTWINQVRILEHRLICIKDYIIFIGITVNLFAIFER